MARRVVHKNSRVGFKIFRVVSRLGRRRVNHSHWGKYNLFPPKEYQKFLIPTVYRRQTHITRESVRDVMQ